MAVKFNITIDDAAAAAIVANHNPDGSLDGVPLEDAMLSLVQFIVREEGRNAVRKQQLEAAQTQIDAGIEATIDSMFTVTIDPQTP